MRQRGLAAEDGGFPRPIGSMGDPAREIKPARPAKR